MSKGILLSGGLDSIALLYWKRPDIAFTVDYGQLPAQAEYQASKKVAESLGIKHQLIKIDCRELGSGDLAGMSPLDIAPESEWWPYRNQLLITLTCMKAISMGVTELFFGSVKTDSFHRDGTSSFFQKINDLIIYQEGGLKISAPAIDLTSAELVRKSDIPQSLLLWAHSCHKSNIPCGNCRGCYKYIYTIDELYG